MRSASLLGLVSLIVYSFCIFKANAHPEKIDYHPAICQPMIAAGGAGGTTPGLQYNLYTVKSVGGDVNIVCPLLLITGSDDNPSDDASASTVTANFAAKLVAAGTAPNCELRSEYTWIASIPAFALGSGTIAGSGSLPLPVTSTFPPTALTPIGFHFTCTPLTKNSQLGSIEVQVQP
jgi:hypothetical protein